MGKHSATPINEAVFILSKIAPLQLQELRDQYPHLSDELREGISAGEKDDTSDGAADYLREKALVVSIALVETANRAEASMGEVVRRIRRSRSARLISQVLVLVGSSALLGAVALDDKTATIVTALLTLLAALGNLLADHGERLLNPQTGNIYEAYETLGTGAFQARQLAEQLKLAMRHQIAAEELIQLTKRGNELCEQLSGALVQLVNQYSKSSASSPKP